MRPDAARAAASALPAAAPGGAQPVAVRFESRKPSGSTLSIDASASTKLPGSSSSSSRARRRQREVVLALRADVVVLLQVARVTASRGSRGTW